MAWLRVNVKYDALLHRDLSRVNGVIVHDPTDLQHCIALALPLAFGRQRNQRQRSDADVAGRKLGRIAHRTVDHQAGPAVLRRRRSPVADDECVFGA